MPASRRAIETTQINTFSSNHHQTHQAYINAALQLPHDRGDHHFFWRRGLAYRGTNSCAHQR